MHWLEYENPYPYLISSSTVNHIRSQYLPVPVFYLFPHTWTGTRISVFPVRETVDNITYVTVPIVIFFQYEKPYLLSISSRTSFYFFQYGKPYSLSMSSRSHFLYLPVPEHVHVFIIFKYGKQKQNIDLCKSHMTQLCNSSHRLKHIDISKC